MRHFSWLSWRHVTPQPPVMNSADGIGEKNIKRSLDYSKVEVLNLLLMATEIEATIFIYKPNYLSINLLPRSSKYRLSLPAVVTIYTFQFLTVNLVQAHAEIAPLPSQRELSLAFQRRQSRSVVSTSLINTEAAT